MAFESRRLRIGSSREVIGTSRTARSDFPSLTWIYGAGAPTWTSSRRSWKILSQESAGEDETESPVLAITGFLQLRFYPEKSA